MYFRVPQNVLTERRSIGKRIREIRARKRTTRVQLAQELGCKKETIALLEGHRECKGVNLNVTTLTRLAAWGNIAPFKLACFVRFVDGDGLRKYTIKQLQELKL